MRAYSFHRWMLLTGFVISIALGSQIWAAGCQELRACRDNTPCRQINPQAKGIDAGEDGEGGIHPFFGYLCNVKTALCNSSCKDDSQCDVCNQYFCVDKKCVKNTKKEAPSICCTDNSNCKGFVCNTGIGQCSTACTTDSQCDTCNQFFCDTTGATGVCKQNTSKPKPNTCPKPEPVEEVDDFEDPEDIEDPSLDEDGLDGGDVDEDLFPDEDTPAPDQVDTPDAGE